MASKRTATEVRELRARLRAQGLCIQCGKPRHPSYRSFCLEHARKHRERSRRNAGSVTWAETGLGRQPRELRAVDSAPRDELAQAARRAARVARLGLLEAPPPRDGLSVPEVARRLDLTKSTVYQFIKKGRLNAWRDHAGNRTVVLEEDLQAFLRSWRRQPKRYSRGALESGDARMAKQASQRPNTQDCGPSAIRVNERQPVLERGVLPPG